MIYSRAGLMHSFVIALILLLIAFGIVFAWLYKSGTLIDDEADVNLCRATMALQAKTQPDIGIIDSNSPLSTSCKRRLLTIGKDIVTVRKAGKFSIEHPLPVYVADAKAASGTKDPQLVKTTKIKEIDKAVVSSVFAESMKRCWTMGLEGDVGIFNARGSYFSRSNVCLLCDQILVDRALPEIIEGTQDDRWLSDYLSETTIPATRSTRPRTYASFLDRDADALSSYPRTAECEEQINLRNPEITDGTYATILVRRFSDWADDGTVASVLGGESCMTTAVVRVTALRNVCNYVAN